MSHIIACALPSPGHVNPMLAVSQHLKSVGHSVTVLTGEVFRDKVIAAGLDFARVGGIANFDYRKPEKTFQGERSVRGMELMLHYFKHRFGDTIPEQDRCIRKIMAEKPVDLILMDTPYLGTFPLLLGPRNKRPPIIGCGVLPMVLLSRDFPPFAKPDTTPEGLLRNKEANRQFEAGFKPATDHINAILSQCGSPPLPRFVADCMYTLPDLFLQFTGEAFEFPRSDMPDTIRFVGPVLPNPTVHFREPAWWDELDRANAVVLVTQGTMANFNLNELIQPTLSALADEDVLVIAATGRPDAGSLVVPSNARVAPFIPFDRLLHKVDVFVTNGGYGAVQHALSIGVPIVAAGESEDKAWVSARVDWSGVGISLATQNPTEDQIRSAVRDVLSQGSYWERAQTLRQSFSGYSALSAIAQAVEAAIASRSPLLAGVASS